MKIFLVSYLLVLSIYDAREKRVPVLLLGSGMAVSAVLLVLEKIQGQQTWNQLLGMLPGMLLIVVAFVTGKAGYADGIVLVVIGALLGYKKTALLFCISLMLISVASVILLLLRKVNGKTRIPYLPFITAAFLVQQVVSIS